MHNIKAFIKNHPWISALMVCAFILILTAILFAENMLIRAGDLLVRKEGPRDADYIVVLQGGIPDRIAHGADLYQQGYADHILMVESKSFTNYDLIHQHQMELPSHVEINKKAALQLGVEEDRVQIIPGKADSTRNEAEIISNYLVEQQNQNSANTETLLLVTSQFHSFRSALIFEEVFEEKDLSHVNIISTPSPYDPFSRDSWWTDRRAARNAFFEYLKLINHYTFSF